MAKSKRIVTGEKEDSLGVYCRRCQRHRNERYFYRAVDTLLDKNNYMSVCKDCINDLYSAFFANDQVTEKTILRLCRVLNVKYDPEAVESTNEVITTYIERGTDPSGIFGVYKAKLEARNRLSHNKSVLDVEDLTFVEPTPNIIREMPEPEDFGTHNIEYYKEKWGTSVEFTMDDYMFLETELSNWKKTHKCDTYADEVMLKEICFKRNEIRRVRNEGGNTNALVKALQEIMKSSALTPAQQTASSNEVSVNAFGVWLRDIETKRPAEWHDEQEKYKDLDGIDEDLADITRSIKNFMTESRDFSSMELESILSEDGELGDDFSLTDT
jgi:hypothetical protein